MRLKVVATAVALAVAAGLMATAADAAPKKKRVVYNRGNTVLISRDESGRTRTRIIVEKRSYLNPGTERFPGERGDHDYAQLPNYRPSGIMDNTAFGGNQTALPNLWTLPGRNNPFVQY